jgi:DNA-binding XRE family transcriptional regulator
MKLSDLKTLDQVTDEHRTDPNFRADWDALAFARTVANQVIQYRVDNELSQRALAEPVGLKQRAIARLEIAESRPRLATLVKLSRATGLAFAGQERNRRGRGLDACPARHRLPSRRPGNPRASVRQ